MVRPAATVWLLGEPGGSRILGPDLREIGHCRGGRAHEVQVDDFEPEAGDPLDEPGQGALIE
jgi:hypothetical protein